MKYSNLLFILFVLTLLSLNQNSKVECSPSPVKFPSIFGGVKNAIATGASVFVPMIPGSPPPLSGAIVNSLFPNQNDPQAVWNSILVYSQAAIDNKIDNATYALVQSELVGYSQLMNEYYLASMSDQDSTPEYLSSVYISCVTQVIRLEQLFKTQQFQALLLPLFAQFANLYLSLIRDGVNYGNQLGWSQSVKTRYDTLMESKIISYAEYSDSVINTHIKSLEYYETIRYPPQLWNQISDQLNHFYVSVTAFSYNWKYFDINIYRNGVSISPVSHILLSNLAGVFNKQDDCIYSACKKLQRPEVVAAKVSSTRMMSKITPYFDNDNGMIGLFIEYSDGSTKLIGRSSGPYSFSHPTTILRQVPIVSVSVSTSPSHTFGITFTYIDSIQVTIGFGPNTQQFDSSYPGQCVVDIVDPGFEGADVGYLIGLSIAFDDIDYRFPVSSSPIAVSQYYYLDSNGETRYQYKQSSSSWSFGGYSFKAFQVPYSIIMDPTTAFVNSTDKDRIFVYRFKFTQSNGDRFYYTTDSSFTSSGWVYDGIPFKVYSESNVVIPTIPVYRYSRTQVPSLGSGVVYGYSTVQNMLGWTKEGIVWYSTSDSTPSFLSYQDLEYKMIQNVGSQKCLTAPTTSGSSVTLSTCDQSNLQQFWYLKYDSFGPHLYNPKTKMYLNSQTTTLIGTTSIPQNNFNILNQLTNGQYTIQEYISSLCLQLNIVSNIVEFKTCDSSNQNQIWNYPSSVLVESSKSIPLFPGACLDSLGLKCPTTLPEGKTLKTSSLSLTMNSNGYLTLKYGSSEVYSLGVTSSTSGPYSITIQSDGNVVLNGKSGTYAGIGCWNLGGQYLNLLDSIYGLPYGLIVQNNQNKMIWSKLGYPTSFKIGLIPGSFIDNQDSTNNYLGVNEFITNGRDYLIVKKIAPGNSHGAYLYGGNPNYGGLTPLWKYEYSNILQEDLRMYVHYNGDTNTFCMVNSITGTYSCHLFGKWNTPSIQSSRYLQLPAPGSDQPTDWAIALRSGTGSLTYGYFGNSKAFGNFALQPNTNTLYQNRFLSIQINQNKYYIKNMFTNQILQESPANLQICNHAWSSTGIYQLIYDTTTTCSSNAKTMIDSSGPPNDRSFETGRSIILLPSMPELVVSDKFYNT
ncbi:hypothetical protein PPL_08450 [Heterostelium album PN500]|uniref:Pesticidal crystal protein N-terminal domain-containing protein n=1 Tax=Heterostelium pallidum (strain ATCC 26659 / Pp 5 / PN500) TaxID=670386 RepID=D3BI82_HETP5|nr:hypothetical protein PPL_08450 [Heterostelium album PN500]EFA78982.1 hypothetical protein PPL_08450 [Heterostelium album PN500]|eukprot:XP_020431106.1 hypothetical protein PPL_08450 [Heterostelium album PN500]